MARTLSIIVVEKDRNKALLIMESLRRAGDYTVEVIAQIAGLARQIQDRAPDVVLIDIANPSRDMLEALTLALNPFERTVATFVDHSAEGLSIAAVNAGVPSHVVDGLQPARVTPMLDAAFARFRVFQRMRTERAETKRALEERKVIDRAKGMVMKFRNNGTVVGFSVALAAKLRAAGHSFDFADARATSLARIAAARRDLRIGVPFPFSMQAELVYYWLLALGLPAPRNVVVRTVPSALMAEAIQPGAINAFCVDEPWGSNAVENGVGELLLPGAAIWACAPKRCSPCAPTGPRPEPELLGRLIRAVWRAGRWLSDPAIHIVAAELLSRPGVLDIAPEIIDRALSGRLVIAPAGEERRVPGFVGFHRGAATFARRGQTEWIGPHLAALNCLDRTGAQRAARAIWRSDLHRRALATTGADLPGASSRIEGALNVPTAVASESGRLILPRDAVFDGRGFEPGTQ